MSWDASLTCIACGGCSYDHEWNYTHNTNRMVREALAGTEWDTGEMSWWRVLDGMSGEDGAAFLSIAIARMEADPDRFRAMNPENGWGNYDELLGILRKMRGASAINPTHAWRVHG